ncbi:uncharacterized protein LOC124157081 isoform X2 [Ischnura elegans]|uniref:uncharacterized protein LOC124157081 isoform X2 n=1 Tax=Ischnura elegans TaxID=197161 RepID=UPI001ED89514|nr:uncharacterized protein LOC124157081 isoform X2 [Ischnura elegans]
MTGSSNSQSSKMQEKESIDRASSSVESNHSVSPELVPKTRLVAMAPLARAQILRSRTSTSGPDSSKSDVEKENGPTSNPEESTTDRALNTMLAAIISRATEDRADNKSRRIRVLDSRGPIGFVEVEKLKKMNEMVIGLQQERARSQALNKENIWREVIGPDDQPLTQVVERSVDQLLSKALSWKKRGSKSVVKPAVSKEDDGQREMTDRGGGKGKSYGKFQSMINIDDMVTVGIERLKIENEAIKKIENEKINEIKNNEVTEQASLSDPKSGTSYLKQKEDEMVNDIRDEIDLCKERVDPSVLRERIRIGLKAAREA